MEGSKRQKTANRKTTAIRREQRIVRTLYCPQFGSPVIFTTCSYLDEIPGITAKEYIPTDG